MYTYYMYTYLGHPSQTESHRSMVTSCPKCIIKPNRGLFALIIFGLLCFGYQFVRKDGHGSRGNQLTERPPYNET